MNTLIKTLPRFTGILLLPWLLLACARLPGNAPALTQEAAPMATSHTQFRVIAHRGARSLAPENTLAAAQKGLASGADGWELDVAMSADGVLILLHDDTLERTSNAALVFPDRSPWVVYDFTLQELEQLDYGSWFVEIDPFEQAAQSNITAADLESYAGLPVTTLREALQFTKDNSWWVNIEIKDASGTAADAVIVERVVALVEELEMQDIALISSFNHAYLRQVKSINPSIATGVLVNKPVSDPVALVREYNAQAFHPSIKVTYAKQVQALREAGYAVNVWTVNDEAEMLDLMAMGVTGIFTDFPQTLKPLAEAR